MNQNQSYNYGSHSLALEEAREAIIRLKTLKPFLSPQDTKTLEILMDKNLMTQIETSIRESKEGKLEPIESILD